MKVLYIGYYKEKSDWGRQTINNILALEKVGVDVVCRSINLSQSQQGCPPELMHLENKDASDADYCIQHVFPDHMVGSHGVFKKNVGIFNRHFTDISYTSWHEKLSMMDEIWITTLSDYWRYKHILALDLDVYRTPYRQLNIPEVGDDFKFYTIQHALDPIGLSWVIAAFHAEFDPSEPVSLILQIESDKANAQKCLEGIDSLSRSIKSNLRLHNSLDVYKKDVIISSPDITQTNRLELHQCCDCYVSSNSSNSLMLNELDAFAFGNTPIVPSGSVLGSGELEGLSLVDSIFQSVQSDGGMWRDVCNGKDFYVRPCELGLRSAMRQAFESRSKNRTNSKRENRVSALAQLEPYSLENAGKIMKERLENDL